MRAASHNFARCLAERLGEVTPDGFEVNARESRIELTFRGRPTVSIATWPVDDDLNGPFEERVATAARAALGAIQDGVMMQLTTPWPVDRFGQLAIADADWVSGSLFAWFGPDLAAATLALRPILPAELVSTVKPTDRGA